MKNPIPIEQTKDGQFYFKVRAANGKTLAHSETYKTRRNAEKGRSALVQAAIVFDLGLWK